MKNVNDSYKESGMNKSDLISKLAKKHNMTEKQATDIVDLMFDGFANELKNGGRIEIRDLGWEFYCSGI